MNRPHDDERLVPLDEYVPGWCPGCGMPETLCMCDDGFVGMHETKGLDDDDGRTANPTTRNCDRF